MAKRFGRNQRRKLQQELEFARQELQGLKRDQLRVYADRERFRDLANRAVAIAFERFMTNKGRVDYVLDRVIEELTRQFGDKARPIIERMLYNPHNQMPRLDARVMTKGEDEITVLRGYIPPIEYNFAVYELSTVGNVTS